MFPIIYHNRSLPLFFIGLVIAFYFPMFYSPAETVNFISNSGFEVGTEGVPSGWNFVSHKPENSIKWIVDDVHSGNRAVQIIATVPEDAGRSTGVYSNLISAPEDVYVEMSAWIKIDNIISSGSYNKGRVVIYFYDINKNRINHSDIQLEGSISDWVKIKNSKITPARTKYLKIGVILTSCSGIMLIDDMKLAITQKPPLVLPTEISEPVIIPKPWKINFGNEIFQVGSLAIIIDMDLGKQGYLKEEVNDFFSQIGISNFRFFSHDDKGKEFYKTHLFITGFDQPTELIEKFKTKFPNNSVKEIGEQGYFFSAGKGIFHNKIYLAAKSEKGRFFGFQTLKQTFVSTSKPKMRAVDILDTPTLEKRGIAMGIQWFSKQKEAIERLSKLKGNSIVNHGSYLNNKFWNKWREDFTSSELLTMKNYLSLCKKHFIIPRLNFGPRSFDRNSNPVAFSSESEVDLIVKKIRLLYEMGFKCFGLSFDDLQNVGQEILLTDSDIAMFGDNIGRAHSFFTQRVFEKIKKSSPDVDFSVIPMNYNDYSCITDKQQRYLSAFSSLPSEVNLIACTVTDEGILRFQKLTNRTITVWSNYMTQFEKSNFIQDYTWPFKAMIDWSNIAKSSVNGFLFLPIMPDYEDTFLVSWKTTADYMWAPERYNSFQAFQSAMTQKKCLVE